MKNMIWIGGTPQMAQQTYNGHRSCNTMA